MPEEELQMLAQIYEKRGLKKDMTLQVAQELTAGDALGAHIRDELGINEISEARPTQAALASGAAFIVGGLKPLLVVLLFPFAGLKYWLYGLTTFFLMVMGIVAVKTGRSKVWKSMLRIAVWGSIAMGLSAGVGYLFGVNV